MSRIYPLLAGLTIVAWVGCGTDSKVSTAEHAEHTAKDFEQSLQGDGLVLVKFGAPWCGPCREVDKELDKLESANTSQLRVVRINVDDEPDLADQYNVSAIPMLLLFKDGERIDEWRGYEEASVFQSAIDQAM